MGYNSALTEALNEFNRKPERPQVTKKKIIDEGTKKVKSRNEIHSNAYAREIKRGDKTFEIIDKIENELKSNDVRIKLMWGRHSQQPYYEDDSDIGIEDSWLKCYFTVGNTEYYITFNLALYFHVDEQGEFTYWEAFDDVPSIVFGEIERFEIGFDDTTGKLISFPATPDGRGIEASHSVDEFIQKLKKLFKWVAETQRGEAKYNAEKETKNKTNESK